MTDAALECLKHFSHLQELHLEGTKVTDAGLEYLEELTRLEVLDLSGTRATDAGLEHLAGLNHLAVLDLSDAEVTDAGLGRIKGLTQLRELDLWRTEVSDAAATDFHEALPECKVDRSSNPITAPASSPAFYVRAKGDRPMFSADVFFAEHDFLPKNGPVPVQPVTLAPASPACSETTPGPSRETRILSRRGSCSRPSRCAPRWARPRTGA